MARLAPCLDAQRKDRQRLRLDVTGAVQGVGFRPFVHRLATCVGLDGFVCNTDAGVTLEIEGSARDVTRFLARLERDVRPPAVIHRIDHATLDPMGERGFTVAPSRAGGAPSALVLPDLALCDDCRAEIRDPANRRYRYPFTSCTQCGPRYSLIEAVPYDRARTAMRDFTLCPACQGEYDNPASRRFHAEINACPDCGPRLALHGPDGAPVATARTAMDRAAQALRDGAILALKGVGGFQLLVDARSAPAVARLRQRKVRPAKPFAVMAGDIAQAHVLAHISALEEELLRSAAAPIVLLRARADAAEPLAPGVAPANPDLGLMLPTTPLHQILMDALRFPIVATSGNRSGEPLAASDAEAFARLSGIADLFLTHDRAIRHPVDDSVMRVIAGQATTLRCARGHAPLRLRDVRQDEPILALGGHMKSSVALAGKGEIVLGPHIGDLDSAETRTALDRGIAGLTALHGHIPALVACDTHPDYHSTRLAESLGSPVRKVPHHLAHILATMIDNDLDGERDGPVLGVAWDGTGHGDDGTIRGGEFIALDDQRYRRVGHLLPFRLPGGAAAVREPRRAALGVLHGLHGDALWEMTDLAPLADFAAGDRPILSAMLGSGLNAPLTSSVGRLFDAVAAILRLCQRASFEGEAAMAVESAARRAAGAFPLPALDLLDVPGQPIQLDWRPMILGLCKAVRAGTPVEPLAAGFHDALAQTIAAMAHHIGLKTLVLTGGCFQNASLIERTMATLAGAGLHVLRHRRVPPNDGGLAVGQAAFAARVLKEETGPCAWPYPARS